MSTEPTELDTLRRWALEAENDYQNALAEFEHLDSRSWRSAEAYARVQSYNRLVDLAWQVVEKAEREVT
jgi:predicted component of type VI protein secretion system